MNTTGKGVPHQPIPGNPKVIPFRKKDPHRFWMTSEFWKRTDLKGEYKALIGVLMAHMDKSYTCWPTHPQLQEQMGIGHSKLEKMLKKLRSMGEISWVHWWDEWGHKRNRYTILMPRKQVEPTPTNQLLAYTPKAVVKHSTIYPEGNETLREAPAKYRTGA